MHILVNLYSNVWEILVITLEVNLCTVYRNLKFSMLSLKHIVYATSYWVGVIQEAVEHPVYLANMFLIKLSLSIFCLFPGSAGDRIQKRARRGRKTSLTSSSSRATSTTRTRAGTWTCHWGTTSSWTRSAGNILCYSNESLVACFLSRLTLLLLGRVWMNLALLRLR